MYDILWCESTHTEANFLRNRLKFQSAAAKCTKQKHCERYNGQTIDRAVNSLQIGKPKRLRANVSQAGPSPSLSPHFIASKFNKFKLNLQQTKHDLVTLLLQAPPAVCCCCCSCQNRRPSPFITVCLCALRGRKKKKQLKISVFKLSVIRKRM